MQAGTDFAGEMAPHPVPIEERLRQIPDALLLTAGYYVSRLPALSRLFEKLA